MRIGINARFLLSGKLEGIGGYTFEIVKEMVAQHPEDEFIFFFDRPYAQEFIVGKNVTPVVLYPPARHAILWYLWFEWAIPYGLKKYKCDVFFTPDNYASLRTNVPTAMVIHDIAYKHFPEGMTKINVAYFYFFTKRFFTKVKKIITVSEAVRQDVLQHFPISEHKIVVNGNGCRPIFKPLNEAQKETVREKHSEGQPYFFYVGAVHPRKNIHRLIAAFDNFKEKNKTPHKLLIAGRFAWQTGEVRSAYENAAYKNDIIFLKYIDNQTLAEVMASAFALTYLSVFEGFGVPLLEAMYCDVPVITSNVTSMPEVVGDAGLCVSPYNVQEISDAMTELYKNPDLVKQCIEKGRVQRQQFTWKRFAEEVYQVLKSL